MHVLMTGATGFIGKHLAEEMMHQNFNVTGTHRRDYKDEEMCRLQGMGLRWVHLRELIDSIHSERYDCVLHLATSYDRIGDPEAIRESNLNFPIKLLREFTNNNGKIFINTDSYYCKGGLNYPAMPYYSSSKNIFKKMGEDIAAESSCRFLTARLEHVYGPRDGRDKFIPFLLRSFRGSSAQIELTECNQLRDFIFVADVCAALIQIIKKIDRLPQDYKEVEIGTGNMVSLKDFIECLARQTHTNTKRLYGVIPKRQGEIEQSFSDLRWTEYIEWRAKKTVLMGIKELCKEVDND